MYKAFPANNKTNKWKIVQKIGKLLKLQKIIGIFNNKNMQHTFIYFYRCKQ